MAKFGEGQPRNPGGQASPHTKRARMAIARLIDDNAEKLQAWLDQIAEQDGPKAAWNCFVDVIEYNLPKLARTEHTGEGGGPVVQRIERVIVRK